MEISVLIKSPSWDDRTKENWLKFKEWIEQNGGKWQEGMGYHKITFTPKEQENHQ